MTDEQKDILIAKMIDNPASLTDAELEMIMRDDELREILEASAAIGSASAVQPDYDMTEEWRRFRPRIRRKPSLTRRLMRVAAVFLGIVVGANILVKLIDHTLAPEPQHIVAKAEQPIEKDDSPANDPEQPEQSEIAEPVAPPTKANKPGTTHIAKAEVPVDEAMELDIDEYLRIQQAQVDNEIAMLNSSVIANELEPLRQMYELMGEDDEVIEIVINNITEP
ncbi:MAG: hypothetical protein K2O00_01690 [Muribaculaceae bacterium]|nr:hypothetical protein [Muribaculaceae bacterium]